LSIIVAACLAYVLSMSISSLHRKLALGGTPEFRGVYTAAIALLAVTVSFACWALVRRWATLNSLHVGALVVWSIAALLVTIKLPGVSFMLAWPLIVGALAALVASPVVLWVATIVAAGLIVPITHAVSAVLLGMTGPGGIAAAVLTSLLAWLLAPQLEAMSAESRWKTASVALLATIVLVAIGLATVRSSPAHPTPSQLVYVQNADSTDAWLTAAGPLANELAATSTGTSSPPAWLRRSYSGRTITYIAAPRVAIDPPTITTVADSALGTERRLIVRVRAAAGTGDLSLRASGARVVNAAVDGRPIDLSRYRRRSASWQLDYSAPPDTGFTLALTVAAGEPL